MENKYRTDVIRLKTKHIWCWCRMHSDFFLFTRYFIAHRMHCSVRVCSSVKHSGYGHKMIFLIAKHFKYFSIAFHWSLESNLLLLINDLTLCCEWLLASNVCYIPNSKRTALLSTDYGPRDLPADVKKNNDNSYFRLTTCWPNWFRFLYTFFYLSIKHIFFLSCWRMIALCIGTIVSVLEKFKQCQSASEVMWKINERWQ